jgi:hypothetical protein
MSVFGGKADVGRVAKTGIEPSLLRSSAFADVHLFGGSNPVGQFQKSLWDSMGRFHKVGHDKQLN